MGILFRKLYLLVWKNFILQIRRPVGTVVEIVLPIGFLALLIIARERINKQEKCTEKFDKVYIYNESKHLFDYSKKLLQREKIKINGTLRLAYYPIDNKTTLLLKSALTNSGLPVILVNKSVKNIPFYNLDDVLNDAREFEDRYIGVIQFHDVEDKTSWDKKVEYSIRLHHTTGKLYNMFGRSTWLTRSAYPDYVRPGASERPLYKSPFLSLQWYVDSAIIRKQTEDARATSARYIQQYPFPNYTQDWFVIMIKSLIPLMNVLAFIYTAQMIVKDIVAEKESRLIECMKMMGLPKWIHWTAWFIKIFAGFLFIIIMQTIVLKFGRIFEYSHGGVVFVSLLLWSVASIFSLFFISVFFSKATRGMIASSILWFGSFAPYLAIQNPDKYEALTKQAKMATCLLPNSCLGIMVQIITRYEGEQLGVNWDNIDQPVTVDENFSLNSAFGMLVLDCFLFLFFTWYIENVFPGDYGIPKPFYFPFQKSYWCGHIVKPHTDTKMEQNNDNFEREPDDMEVGISINNLRKVFKSAIGKKVAVDGLSLNIYKGQITALLGHNGAGKTTSLSMLTGLFPPSNGSAIINGRSISTDMDAIRDSLGLCPQYNVLFERLTVREHLQFFSALKGVPKSDAEIEITKLLTDMQLMNKENQQSSTLSGGMKRKLNCAIALVGGSETIILDEPTSGMDPYARRATWDVLQRYRGNKTIILTTHFMDEADYLGDRIAIMKDGKVRCCGSSLFLKKRFGIGYHLTLVKGPYFKENNTISAINSIVPTAKMTGNVAAELSYILHEDTAKDFKELFETLEEGKERIGITSFGVSVTTLEEVFIKVGEDDFSFETDKNVEEVTKDDARLQSRADSNLNTKIDTDALRHGFALRSSQFKAMFLKRFLNSKRQKRGVILQLLLPMGLLLLGLLLSLSQNTQQDDPPRRMTLQMLKREGEDLFAFFGNTLSPPESRSKFKDVATSYYSAVDVELQDKSGEISRIENGNKGEKVNIFYSKNPYRNGNLTNNTDACCKYQYLVLNEQCANLRKSCFVGKCKLTPIVANTSFLQEYVLEDSGKFFKKYFIKNVAGFTIDEKTNGPIVWYSNQAFHTLPSAYSAVSNIILREKKNDTSYEIVTYNHPLPRNTREKSELATQNWGNLTLIIFHQIGICLLAASFITFLVVEKVSKAKHVQFVSGVNSVCYWGATYCWDFINFLFPAVGFLILFAIFNLEDYKGELGAVFLTTLLFGLSVLPGVYLLSYLFTNPLAAYGNSSMLTQILSLAMYIAVIICNVVDEREAADKMHHVFLLFPTYAYPKALGDIAINVAERANCNKDLASMFICSYREKKEGRKLYQDDTFSMDSPGIGLHCLYMFLVALGEFILVLLVEENFFLGYVLSSCNNNKVYAGGDTEDVDVAEERNKIKYMQESEYSSTALIVEDLTKVYPRNGIMAVDHINVKIPKGECFGLLGVNGAGKTTTFGMLTGELGITEGKAYIHGYNLKTQLKQVQQLIGYCPQFDALVDTLTGREMLRMFAQLRGIEGKMVDEIVDSVIESLDLKQYADKMCGNYSGGNRRKLSAGLALVGNPAIIFLDEPSSGMDPMTRRRLWDTLSDVVNSGKSIVLTSHSMEECEALCTRLVIMVNGKFKCIGSIQHLKSRFGQGYTVVLKIGSNYNINNNDGVVQYTNLAHESYAAENNVRPVDCVKQFMQTEFPGAFLIEEHQGFLQYQIVQNDVKLSHVFGVLEENVESLGIIDYSVSQTSLEQVFINFAKGQHTDDRVNKKSCFSCQCF